MVSILLPRFLKRKYGFLTNLFHLVKEKWFLAGSRPHASIVQGKCLPFCRGNQSTRSGLSLPVPLEGYRSWSHLCSLSQKLHNSRMEMDISQVTFVAAEEGDENQFTCHVRCLCHTTEHLVGCLQHTLLLDGSVWSGVTAVVLAKEQLYLLYKLSQGIAALQKHGSEMLTTEVTESADNQWHFEWVLYKATNVLLEPYLQLHAVFFCLHQNKKQKPQNQNKKKQIKPTKQNTTKKPPRDYSNKAWLFTVSLQLAHS